MYKISELRSKSREELLKMSVSDLDAKESGKVLIEHLQKIITSKSERFETKHKSKNGKIIEIEVSAKYIDYGYDYIVVFIRDITERKIYAEAIKKSEEKYRNLFREILFKIISNKCYKLVF